MVTPWALPRRAPPSCRARNCWSRRPRHRWCGVRIRMAHAPDGSCGRKRMAPLIDVRSANERGAPQAIAKALGLLGVADAGPVDHDPPRTDARPFDIRSARYGRRGLDLMASIKSGNSQLAARKVMRRHLRPSDVLDAIKSGRVGRIALDSCRMVGGRLAARPDRLDPRRQRRRSERLRRSFVGGAALVCRSHVDQRRHLNSPP